MYIGVKDVTALKDYRLRLTFENGEQRIFNVTPYLDTGIFRELRDPSLFNSVKVQFDTVEWTNGADICPEELYERSEPAAV
jgi:hypothetical protein